MNRGILPHCVDVFQEDGFWRLRLREDLSLADGTEERSSPEPVGCVPRQAQPSNRRLMSAASHGQPATTFFPGPGGTCSPN